jgi:2-iminobutanoate/2-iminopropanoate deaminase
MSEQHSLKTVSTPSAPTAVGPYSQGVIVRDLLFISGQLPVNPQTGEFVQGGIEESTRQVIKNIKAVAEAAGADLNQVVKTTVFLTDISCFPIVNKAYGEFFDTPLPARSAVQVTALPKGAEIEIEAVVLLPRSKKRFK